MFVNVKWLVVKAFHGNLKRHLVWKIWLHIKLLLLRILMRYEAGIKFYTRLKLISLASSNWYCCISRLSFWIMLLLLVLSLSSFRFASSSIRRGSLWSCDIFCFSVIFSSIVPAILSILLSTRTSTTAIYLSINHSTCFIARLIVVQWSTISFHSDLI